MDDGNGQIVELADDLLGESEDPASIITDPILKEVLRVTSEARQAYEELHQLTGVTPENEEEHMELAKKTCDAKVTLKAHLATLRGLNRRVAKQTRATKVATAAARTEVDSLHLGLQNLYYESKHLQGEIDACKNYPHTYTSLPLIPLEEFLEKSPEYRHKGEEEIMKARIEDEYDERVKLEEQRKALVARKMELVRENTRRKDLLAQVDKDLEHFIETAAPIQEKFEQEY